MIKKMFPGFLPLLAGFLLVPLSISALELSQGNLILQVHENTGRFSLYQGRRESRVRPQALFVDQDPRTSFSSVLINNRTYRLGETSVFTLNTETNDSSIILRWESDVAQVTQTFSLSSDPKDPSFVFLRMDISLYNISMGDIDIGYRFCLDTNLGERAEHHFTSDTGRVITGESMLFPARDSDTNLISANERAAFMLSINHSKLIAPDSVHIANWKRLSDAPWKAPHLPGRNFNNLPYSVNDSAVSLYYNHRRLARGEKHEYSVLMAPARIGGFPSLSTQSTSIKPVPSSPSAEDLSLMKDLQELQTLIDRLEQAKFDGIMPDEAELTRMEELLSRLSGYVDE